VLEWERLREWSRRVAGLALSDGATDQLQRYVDVLRVWNRKVALVSQDDLAVVLDKHVADALFAAAHCRDARAVADLGSGAGFPGLVIAIVWPTLRVTLIEARGKKVSFLEEACRVATVGNANPVQGRIEAVSADPHHRGAYDRVTSRALADLDALRTLAQPLAAPGGILLAMRSAAAPVPSDARRIDYALPDGTPRVLVTIAL
jgi:16S rRNA (guanine527-N7)-methyltransferase